MKKRYNVSMLDLKSEYNFLKKGIQKQLNDCFKSQGWILGQKVSELERAVAKYLGVKHAVGVASGTDALVLSLSALALKKKKKVFFNRKDEIITTPFTFVATAEAIIRAGATPVFVDINHDTFNISPCAIEAAITKNTVGILPVHLYGLGADMAEILKIAKKHNLSVIEDTAQGFGSRYKGKKLGTIGDFGAFSFFPSKNLGGFGDGGLVATDDSELAEAVKILRNHGQKVKYKADYLGFNSRLDSIQAAVLLAKLKYIDKFNNLRRKVAKEYNDSFKNIKEIKVPFEPKDNFHVYHLYTIKVSSKRDEFVKYLNSKGILARVYYPILLHKMKAFKNSKVKDLKSAKSIVLKVLSLPIHPFLKKDEIKFIVQTVQEFF